ncbi:MAG: hypothetical protein ABII06_12885 [Pseudomonadota bacterium]
MHAVIILKIIGFLIMIGVMGFAWTLWLGASRLEEEIKAKLNRSGEE